MVLVADTARDDVPPWSGATPVDGQPAAYVCRHHVCAAPVTDPSDLTAGCSEAASVRLSVRGARLEA